MDAVLTHPTVRPRTRWRRFALACSAAVVLTLALTMAVAPGSAPADQTVRIDRLAAEGVRFTSAYATAAICAPSRVALLTGRYPIRFGLQGNFGPDPPGGLPAEERTLAEALRGVGLTIGLDQRRHLGTDEFWPDQLVGLSVTDPTVDKRTSREIRVSLSRNRLSRTKRSRFSSLTTTPS